MALQREVKGAGTDKIVIDGVKELKGTEYEVIPDRLIAGSMLMAAGVTGGSVTIENIIPEHLTSCLEKLKEVGMEFSVGEKSVSVQKASGRLKATRVKTGMYPLFATDLQQPITSLLLVPEGKSIITDPIYPNRFNHIPELKRMGASIEVKGNSAYILGNQTLKGNWVHATDVRAGTCLILAGLMTEGITRITGVEHIERGCSSITELFRGIGANLKECQTSEPEVGVNLDVC
nr:hypothetical protein [Pseudalkalibacillus caeni]